MIGWDELTSEAAEPDFTPVPFSAPLWVLYSSGTTGLPKPIVQSVGGILLEHLKSLRLHWDLGPGDRFLWFTTTGWMMWNFLIGGLLVGATVVLYDGSPGHPDLMTLWELAERHRVSLFGMSAPYVAACEKAGLTPAAELDLTSIARHRLDRFAPVHRRFPLDPRSGRCRHPDRVVLRRHRHLHRHRRWGAHRAGMDGGDLLPCAGRQGRVVLADRRVADRRGR